MLISERGVIKPVGIRNHLCPGDLLATFVESPVEKANFDVAFEYLLAFEFKIELDGAMGRWMGRPHLQFHGLER